MSVQHAREILRVRPDACPKTINRAFRRVSYSVHPDRHPADSGATEKFKMYQYAHDLLLKPPANAKKKGPSAKGQGPGVDTSRVKDYCWGRRWSEPVKISSAEVDQLLKEREWVILKYCALSALDMMVQVRAMCHLAAGRKYHDVLKISKMHVDKSRQKTLCALSIFERDIEILASGTLYQQEPAKLEEILDFTLRITYKPEVAKRILDLYGAGSFFSGLSAIKDTQTAKDVLDILSQEKKWDDLKEAALYFNAAERPELRDHSIAVLGSHTDEIIGAQRDDLLSFLWHNTTDKGVKKRIRKSHFQSEKYGQILGLMAADALIGAAYGAGRVARAYKDRHQPR